MSESTTYASTNGASKIVITREHLYIPSPRFTGRRNHKLRRFRRHMMDARNVFHDLLLWRRGSGVEEAWYERTIHEEINGKEKYGKIQRVN